MFKTGSFKIHIGPTIKLYALSPVQLCDPMDQSPPGSTGAGCHFFLQGILPTWGLNLSVYSQPVTLLGNET